MQLYLAPMEGLTGYITRNAFYHHFGGFDKYFTPFIPEGKGMHKKTLRDLAPENNEGICLVPQILGNHAEEVLILSRRLKQMGFEEININLGCPSGTVSSKGRGSGFLAYPEELDHFLYEIYSQIDVTLTVKTRVGYRNADDWDLLMDIYRRYPDMKELIIHPRTREDMYTGPVRMDLWEQAYFYFKDSGISLCYNGDINNQHDFAQLADRYPQTSRYMIGRGAFRHPGLAVSLKAANISPSGQVRPCQDTVRKNLPGDLSGLWDEEEYRRKLHAYHDEILNNYLEIFSGPKDAIFRMKEIWYYLSESFEDCEKPLKKIRKSQDLRDYNLAAEQIFRQLPLAPF